MGLKLIDSHGSPFFFFLNPLYKKMNNLKLYKFSFNFLYILIYFLTSYAKQNARF